MKEKEDTKKKKSKIPKEISQKFYKKVVYNVLKAVAILAYFAILNFSYMNINQESVIGDIKILATALLIAGIGMLEAAYKNDSGEQGLTAIELIFLSLHSLSIMHVIKMFQYRFEFYLLTSSYVFAIYYILKSIIMYTKGRKEYLQDLSDISEIVKKEEPVKKEAKKRNVEEKRGKKND